MTEKPKFQRREMLRFKEELSALPEREADEISSAEALVLLAPALRALRRRRYDWAALQVLLKAKGIVVSDAVLKKRVAQAGDGGAPARRKKMGSERNLPTGLPGSGSPPEPRGDLAPTITKPADAPLKATTTVFLDAGAVGETSRVRAKESSEVSPPAAPRAILWPGETAGPAAGSGAGTKKTPSE